MCSTFFNQRHLANLKPLFPGSWSALEPFYRTFVCLRPPRTGPAHNVCAPRSSISPVQADLNSLFSGLWSVLEPSYNLLKLVSCDSGQAPPTAGGSQHTLSLPNTPQELHSALRFLRLLNTLANRIAEFYEKHRPPKVRPAHFGGLSHR